VDWRALNAIAGPEPTLRRMAPGWRVIPVLAASALLVAVFGSAVGRQGGIRILVLAVLGVALVAMGGLVTRPDSESGAVTSTVRIDVAILFGWILLVATAVALLVDLAG
jgi:hypothetical protein